MSKELEEKVEQYNKLPVCELAFALAKAEIELEKAKDKVEFIDLIMNVDLCDNCTRLVEVALGIEKSSGPGQT